MLVATLWCWQGKCYYKRFRAHAQITWIDSPTCVWQKKGKEGGRLEGKEQGRINITDFSLRLGLGGRIPRLGTIATNVFLPTPGIYKSFYSVILIGEKWHLILIFISLIAIEIEHLYHMFIDYLYSLFYELACSYWFLTFST